MTAEKTSKAAADTGPVPTDASPPTDGQVAVALRQAYEEAVREDVPAEFLDLLSKLS